MGNKPVEPKEELITAVAPRGTKALADYLRSVEGPENAPFRVDDFYESLALAVLLNPEPLRKLIGSN